MGFGVLEKVSFDVFCLLVEKQGKRIGFGPKA